MALTPVPMSTPELNDVLLDIVHALGDRDSFGGSIEYDALGGPPCPQCQGSGSTGQHIDLDPIQCDLCDGLGCEPLPPGKDFWVHGVYRVGNSQGQGGVRIVGKPVS